MKRGNERRPQRSRSIMALLLMGRDASQGRLVLDHHNQAAVDWDNRANRYLYRAEGQVGRAVARMLGGRALDAPTWSLLRRAVTVHGVGGVPMGTDRAHGVIDEHGEVHGHRGLYVVDAAAVPSTTGVNPSASILAMAERNVERAIRSMLGDERWEVPEMPDVTPAEVPEDQAMLLMSSAPESASALVRPHHFARRGGRRRRRGPHSLLGTLKLASSIRGDAFTRTKRSAAAARFLTYFTKSALHGMMLERTAAQGRDRPDDRAA